MYIHKGINTRRQGWGPSSSLPHNDLFVLFFSQHTFSPIVASRVKNTSTLLNTSVLLLSLFEPSDLLLQFGLLLLGLLYNCYPRIFIYHHTWNSIYIIPVLDCLFPEHYAFFYFSTVSQKSCLGEIMLGILTLTLSLSLPTFIHLSWCYIP